MMLSLLSLGSRRNLPRALLALGCLVLASCDRSDPLGEVTGTVTRAGVPLKQVMVAFVPDQVANPEALRSTGATDDQGKFTLVCDDGRPGAVLGRHTVLIIDLALDVPVVVKGSDEENLGGPPRRSLVPPAYHSPNTSPLKQEVAAGSQQIDLEIPVAK